MKNETEYFYTWNKDSTSIGIIWDMFKAYIYGILIADWAFKDKQCRAIRAGFIGNI